VKRLRYVIGAVGAAPALGLMVPAAHATAATRHAPGDARKTVSLRHGQTPLISCGHGHTKYTQHGLLGGQIGYSGTTCIHSQWADLDRHQTGLTERIRFYSAGGSMLATRWQAGKFRTSQTTYFSSVPNLNAHEVCEALVANGNHNDVKYGPVCETA
jgi:hypothetical protein